MNNQTNHQRPQTPGVFHPSDNPEKDMRMRALQHFYIDSVISKRKKCWYKKHENLDATLALKTIELSVAATVDLWSEQMLSGNNSYPHPRAECPTVLTNLRRFQGQKRRAEFQDRAVSTVNDGYTTTKELADLVGYYSERNTEVNLGNALMCMLSHYLYPRGVSVRVTELSVLQSVVYENEGPTLCPGLLFLMTESKTNHFGHLQIGGCIRNKFVEMCPLMLLSLSTCLPASSRMVKHFQTFLRQKIGSGTAVKRGLLACGINSSKATHLFRGTSARMANVFGVDESQI
ncbi:conserved hypothetical protein [Mucor ambiguus]|uniref:Ndc10 domain-containing protein n=1 Tax=Mucor ambiguus TaxID=91626 RepID=A0A0C9LS75_9FUNG|nr:conserved hypothetical protein [Mucor ambiguus]